MRGVDVRELYFWELIPVTGHVMGEIFLGSFIHLLVDSDPNDGPLRIPSLPLRIENNVDVEAGCVPGIPRPVLRFLDSEDEPISIDHEHIQPFLERTGGKGHCGRKENDKDEKTQMFQSFLPNYRKRIGPQVRGIVNRLAAAPRTRSSTLGGEQTAGDYLTTQLAPGR